MEGRSPDGREPAEALHRQVFERNPAVQLLIDPATERIVDANPAACRFYGLSREQLAGRGFGDLTPLPPEELSSVLTRAMAEEGGVFGLPQRVPSGDRREVELHAGPVPVGDRRLLFAILLDVSGLKRAEAAVESQMAALGASIDGMAILDAAGKHIFVNAAYAEIFGHQGLQALQGSPWQALYDREEAERFEGEVWPGLRVSGRWRGEAVGRRRDGSSFPQELSLTAIEGGGTVCVVRDISLRKAAERALRHSEEKHRSILDSMEEGYYETDLKGNFTFVNPAVARFLGCRPEELIGMSNRRYTDPENARKVHAHFNQVYRTGEPAPPVAWEVVRPDGTRRQVAASVALIRDSAGRPCGFRGIASDITERKQAEDALRESEERYRRLVDLSPDGIAIYVEGKVVFVNQAAVRMAGARSPEELVGRTALSFVHPDSQPLVIERMRKLQEGGQPLPLVEERFVRLDGSSIDVEAASVPFTYGDKRAVQVIVRDITGRKRAQRLQAALFKISETASSVERIEQLYPALHRIVGELMDARNFYIALRDDAGGIGFPYFVDECDPVPPAIKPGRTLTEYLLRTGEPLLASPEVFRALVERGEVENVGAPSVDWLGAPLKHAQRILGAIVVQSYRETVRYSEADKDLLTFLSQHVATAIDRTRAVEALRESEAKFRALAETAPGGIFIFQGSRFRYVNDAMLEMSGYSREELLQGAFWDAIHPEFRDLVRERGLARQRGEAVPSRYEFKILSKDGAERWIDASAALVEFGGKPAVLATAFDITDRKRAEEQIRSLAFHDALTGLPNRRLFGDRLSLAVAQAHRLGQRVAVLFLDLDHFKAINDSLGHDLGDRLLQGVAERLARVVREGDTVARLAGDEFTLLLPGVSRTLDAAKVAEKILESLRQAFHLDGHQLQITCSIGISVYPEDGRSAEVLLRGADAAMYRAKEEGRDNYQLCSSTMTTRAVERLTLERGLRQALDRGELEVHYLIVVSGDGRDPDGVEAQMRWRRAQGEVVDPADLVAVAEASGLVLTLGPWLWRIACVQARAWRDAGHRLLRLGVFLSTRQLQQPDLAEQLLDVLADTGLPPGCLDLQIDHTAPLHSDLTTRGLRDLRTRGVRITVDGFGIGASCLGDLKRLPVDAIKLHPSLVGAVDSSPDDAALVHAILALGRSLGLAVVAAGVENEAQRQFLAAHGCERMQGGLFGGPLPADRCEAMLLSG